MAGFTPEHDHFQELLYRISGQIAGMFQDTESRLLAEIARRLIRNLPENPELGERLRIIQDLEKYAKNLTSNLTREYAEQVITQAARDGAASTLRLPSIPQLTTLTDEHVLAAALTAFDLGNKFEDMRARILRFPRDAMGEYVAGGDVYQQVIANNVPKALLGASKSQARKAALTEFLEQGITGFTDIAGRNWRIGTYAEMATRTAVTRAYTDAKVHTAGAVGIDLFSIIGGRNACDHCAPWFGKIVAATGPAGWRDVPHSFEDGTTRVYVSGNLADWRASGANHPNCSCLPAEYLPGFSIPTAASEYDPEAHAARDRLRELEVRERAAKRKRLIAEASGDAETAAAAKRRIRAIQKQTREHVAATGQRRRYERAQVSFADGQRSAIREAVLPPVDTHARVAPFVPSGLSLEDHELATANRLADRGLRVRFRELDTGFKVKSIDATIDSELWEIKSPQGSGPSTISNQLHRAKAQGARRVVIDNARTPLDDAAVLAELRRRFAAGDWYVALIHVASDGTVTRLSR